LLFQGKFPPGFSSIFVLLLCGQYPLPSQVHLQSVQLGRQELQRVQLLEPVLELQRQGLELLEPLLPREQEGLHCNKSPFLPSSMLELVVAYPELDHNLHTLF
jgi:hypothetical protein